MRNLILLSLLVLGACTVVPNPDGYTYRVEPLVQVPVEPVYTAPVYPYPYPYPYPHYTPVVPYGRYRR